MVSPGKWKVQIMDRLFDHYHCIIQIEFGNWGELSQSEAVSHTGNPCPEELRQEDCQEFHHSLGSVGFSLINPVCLPCSHGYHVWYLKPSHRPVIAQNPCPAWEITELGSAPTFVHFRNTTRTVRAGSCLRVCFFFCHSLNITEVLVWIWRSGPSFDQLPQ